MATDVSVEAMFRGHHYYLYGVLATWQWLEMLVLRQCLEPPLLFVWSAGNLAMVTDVSVEAMFRGHHYYLYGVLATWQWLQMLVLR